MPKRYYFLAPNFDINPDSETAPRLGSIYIDLECLGLSGPLNQHDLVPPPAELRNSSAVSDFRDTTTSRARGSAGLRVGLGGGVDLAYTFAKSQDTTYRCARLETAEFAPTEEFVAGSIEASARVRRYLDNAIVGRRRVYMVTGLKVAEGLRAETAAQTGHEPRSAATSPEGALAVAAAPVTVGAQLGLAVESTRAVEWQALDAVLFAYRVVRIRRRSDGGVKFGHRSGGRYALEDDDDDSEDDDEGASSWVLEDLDEKENHGGFGRLVPVEIRVGQ